jgi:arylsulfatase A-like enzyme
MRRMTLSTLRRCLLTAVFLGLCAAEVTIAQSVPNIVLILRTPIAMRWPGHVKPERNDRTLAGSIDIAPTMLRAAEIEPPAAMVGLDLRDRRALARRTELFGSLSAHTSVDLNNPVRNLKYRYVIREDRWKLILPYEPNRKVTLTINGLTADWMFLGPELFNVRDEPHETRNLVQERARTVEELRALLDN